MYTRNVSYYRRNSNKFAYCKFTLVWEIILTPPPHPPTLRLCLTWASLCWLSASPGLAMALLVSSIRLADLSMTSPAQSSMAFRAGMSSVLAATPLAAEAKDFRAWATSLAAIPRPNRREGNDPANSTAVKTWNGQTGVHKSHFLANFSMIWNSSIINNMLHIKFCI